MSMKYRRTNTTVSFINYHFVFCPRYRRKIFSIPGVEERFKELIVKICDELNIEDISIECSIDHVYLYLNAPPTISASDIMYKIKCNTSRIIRQEFNQLSHIPSLWTRNFFVSTYDNISIKTIKEYVDEQKIR